MAYFNLILKNQVSEFEDYQLIESPNGRVELDLSLNRRIFLINNPSTPQILISFINLNLSDNQFKEWVLYIQNINNSITDIKLCFEDLTIKWDYLPSPIISVKQNSVLAYYFCKDVFNDSINGVYIGEYLISGFHDTISKPNIITPQNNDILDKTAISISSSEFTTEILHDTHSSTDYKITTDNIGKEIVYSIDKSDNLKNITLDDLSSVLSSNTIYYIFVRYYGTLIKSPSDWSDPISFTVT